MNPARRNKIDLDKLTDEEKKLFRMYGKLPTGKNVLSNKLKERKYFDSGDYALSKAGKTSGPVGVNHPSPETIPHATANAAITHNTSPVKESSLVHETEIDEKTGDPDAQSADADTQSTSTSTSNQTTPVPATPAPTPASTQSSSTTSTSTNNS
uniref:Uncharacterized protein C10F6.16 n=1 Tax=Anthurium amnicola TaxID=1678845 RepID=A0A1D1ZD76_9ARAE